MAATATKLTEQEHLALAKSLIERCKQLPAEDIRVLFQKDFLRTWDFSLNTIEAVVLVAQALEHLYKANVSSHIFKGGLAVSIFRDKSTRTRFSFASASSLLGLSVSDLDETKSQIAHGETVRETANMISFATEIIGIRDDMFIRQGHAYMLQVGEAVTLGENEGVLPHRPSVINLQCDEDHPTQSTADLVHLIKHFGGVQNLKGKTLAMTWAYSPSYGKPLSVPQGIVALMTRYGMNVRLAHPPGYDLLPEIVQVAKDNATTSGGSFSVMSSMAEAFEGADVVYPKSWAPVAVMERRRDLLTKGAAGAEAMAALEKECLENNAKFTDWECTEALMSTTKNGGKDALYMHCLPADITAVSCKQGEVEASVLDRYRAPLYKEAENKVYCIASMMLTSRCENPVATLERIVDRNEPVRF